MEKVRYALALGAAAALLMAAYDPAATRHDTHRPDTQIGFSVPGF